MQHLSRKFFLAICRAQQSLGVRTLPQLFQAEYDRLSTTPGTSAPVQRAFIQPPASKKTARGIATAMERVELPKCLGNQRLIDEVRLLWLKEWTTADVLWRSQKYYAILSKRSPFIMSFDALMSNGKGFVVGSLGSNTITFDPKHPLGAEVLESLYAQKSSRRKTRIRRIRFALFMILLAWILERCGRLFSFKSLAEQILSEFKRSEQLLSRTAPAVKIIPRNDPASLRVEKILARIIAANGLNSMELEFFLINASSTINASASHYDKAQICIYNGILSACKDDHDIAAVLSHEVAHIVADHHAKGIARSQTFVKNLRDDIAFIRQATISQQNYSTSFAIVYGGVLLAKMMWHSRQQEYEADSIGLFIMNKGGYDIRRITDFAERFSKVKEANSRRKGKVCKPAWYMRSHPSGKRRIKSATKVTERILRNSKQQRSSLTRF